MNTDLLAELRWRELLYDETQGLSEALKQEKLTGYIGFDPTAASLHVGTLLPIMGLARLQRFGHSPIALVGGGTGLIGDPSGKSHERKLLTRDQVEENIQGIRRQLEPFLDFESSSNPARIVNNAEWLCEVHLVDFLRDIGKHFSVNAMLHKDSVKQRIEHEEGISFTEFAYMLLQAYDFLVLNERFGCRLQMGGSDQWGNITAGIELIRRVRSQRAFGVVLPLVISATGVKFGKTEAGTVWLDPALTSPYRFYQFWLNTDDRDVLTYLRYFTWMSKTTIEEVAEEHLEAPDKREAHRRLAVEVTRAVHGATETDKAIKASRVLFGGEVADLEAEQIEDVFGDVPSIDIDSAELSKATVVSLLSASGLARSKGEARRLIQGGGIYLNSLRTTDVQARVDRDSCLHGRFLVLRKGAKNYRLVRVVGDRD